MTNHEKTRRFFIYLFIISCIIVFHAANNIVWLSQNDSLQGCGVPLHLMRQLEFFNASSYIENMQIPLLEKLQRWSWLLRYNNSSWSPAVCILPSFVNFIFGKTTFVTIMSNIVYLFILMFAVYALGTYYQNQKTGVLAAFIVSMYPGIWGISRKFGLDFPITALGALAIYLLIKTSRFKKLIFSFLFTVIFSIGLLIKLQLTIFIFPSFIWIFYRNIRSILRYRAKNNHLTEKKLLELPGAKRIITMAMSLGCSLMISYVLWSGKIGMMWSIFSQHVRGNNLAVYSGEVDNAGILGHLLFYPKAIISNTSFLFFLPAVAACVFIFLKKNKIRQKMFLLLWIIAPLIFFTLIFVKRDKYIFPLLPTLAIITAIWINNIKPSLRRLAGLGIIITLSLLQFFALSYNLRLLPKGLFKNSFTSAWVHSPMGNNHKEVIDALCAAAPAKMNIPLAIFKNNNLLPYHVTTGLEYRVNLAYFPHIIPFRIFLERRLLEVIDKKDMKKAPDLLIIPGEISTTKIREIIKNSYAPLRQRLLLPENVSLTLFQKKIVAK